jgi:hypothetical protein
MNWVMNNFQVSLEIDESHIGFDLVAARHKASWVIKSPSVSIFELRQTVLEGNDGRVFGSLRGAVGDEVAWGTSYHCRDLQRLA